MDLRGDLLCLFGPLIHIGTRGRSTIELSHQTVKEYFLPTEGDPRYPEAGRSFLGDDRHIDIALACLFCIVHARRNLVDHRPPSFFEAATILSHGPGGSSPFYPYARMYTTNHLNEAMRGKESPSKISQFKTFYGRTWGRSVSEHLEYRPSRKARRRHRRRE